MADAVGLAISLAGAALKLVVFSIDFVDDAKQVYRQGATDRTLDLSRVLESVEDATTVLQHQIEKNQVADISVLDPNEQLLRELSLRAAEIGRELTTKLRRITNEEGSKWKSFRTVVLGIWDEKELRKTQQSLSDIKDQMQFSILISLRNKVNRSHDEVNSNILSVLEAAAHHRAESKEDHVEIIQLLNQTDSSAEGRHQELVKQNNLLLEAVNAMSISRSPSPVPPSSPKAIDDQDRKHAENTILNTLWYATIWDREETISEAHKKTFQWVFENPDNTGKRWSNLTDFLSGETTSYWITGKPGSGKSTLMKFISEHEQTRMLLEQWAADKKLVKASFYFFYNGSEDQKSEYGLVRSLLSSILGQRRDLIPVAFEYRFQGALEGRLQKDPTLAELKRALRDLFEYDHGYRFFISIDGLDEFDPEISRTSVASLIGLTRLLSNFQNVKVLISSRPLPEFEHGYEGQPCLRIHDLTHDDIHRYTEERLMSHRSMQRFAKREPASTHDLLQAIVQASLGVFLWVRLVCDSLVYGLTNAETIIDLRQRVESTPSDLQDLYETMLLRVEPRYKPETARLLSLMYENRRGPNAEFTLLDLWFAVHADDDMVQQTPIKPIEDEEIEERVEDLETRLKSRCLGLIEVAPSMLTQEILTTHKQSPSSLIYDLSTDNRKAIARFLHRSVYEFLERKEIWEKYIKAHFTHDFEPHLSLFRSAILVIKTCRSTTEANWVTITRLSIVAALRASMCEVVTSQSTLKLLPEFDSTMEEIVNTFHVFKNIPKIDYKYQTSSTGVITQHWFRWIQYFHEHTTTDWFGNYTEACDTDCGSLITFAVHFGLTPYVRREINERGSGILKKEGLPLLAYSILPMHLGDYLRLDGNHHMATLLLDQGLDPNEMYGDKSVWEWFLDSLHGRPKRIWSTNHEYPDWLDEGFLATIRTMILHGADINKSMVSYANKESRREGTKCTILLCLRRHYEHCVSFPILPENEKYGRWSKYFARTTAIIKEIVDYLESKGAEEREWEDGQLIYVKVNDTAIPAIQSQVTEDDQSLKYSKTPSTLTSASQLVTISATNSLPPPKPGHDEQSEIGKHAQKDKTEEDEHRRGEKEVKLAEIIHPGVTTAKKRRKWYQKLFRRNKRV
ncbi:hypothetical protein GGR57DRAFT_155231 [Xylariaceae sp. FL1272]|nr:hypothetical protein GGR57DRAFT_155231 [Xylariaceae sp. FL1272]